MAQGILRQIDSSDLFNHLFSQSQIVAVEDISKAGALAFRHKIGSKIGYLFTRNLPIFPQCSNR